MEPVCLSFTVCGAVTLASGLMKVVEKLER